MVENSKNEMQAILLAFSFQISRKNLAKLLVIEAGVYVGGGVGTGLERRAGRWCMSHSEFICQGYTYLKMMIFFFFS